MFGAPRLIFGGTAGPGLIYGCNEASAPVFMFCAPRLIFSGTEGVRSRFIFCAPRVIFGGTEGVRSYFHVLRSRTRFQRCRVRRVPFSCFVRPDSFLAVPRVSGPVFMFCALELIFGVSEVVRSRFLIWCARTRFWRYKGCRLPY
jgi:hypothetical protein